MNHTPIFTGTVQNQRLIVNNKESFAQYIAGLTGQNLEIIVRQKEVKRSNRQNRYYWGVVLPTLCGYFGYERQEMHDALRMVLLRKPANSHTLPDTVRSTTELTVKEFEEYLESVRRWASIHHNIIIPLPNETLESEYDN